MGRTLVTGVQIGDGTIQSVDIEDGGVKRSDLNTTSTGEAVITKIIAGSGIEISETGVDSGTGDVTITATVTSTGGISESEHRALDQLVHNIAEDSYQEITKTGNKVTSIIYYTDTGKTEKIREELITYTGNIVTQIVTNQYSAGILVETFIETINYTNNQVSSIDGVLI